MNTNEAREALLLYRGSIDDADPKIQEALAYARRDPELAACMREQRSSYDAIRSKFHKLNRRAILPKGLSVSARFRFVDLGLKC
jgi:hypothetical protein